MKQEKKVPTPPYREGWKHKRLLGFCLVLGLMAALPLDSYAGKYSSSGSGRPSFSGGSRSGGFSSRPSYSSGSRPSGSKPSYSGSRPGSRPSYSSGGHPSAAPRSGSTPGKAYHSGGRTYTPVTPSGAKPKGGAFDGNAAAAQRRAESKANYVKGAEPRATYTTPTGRTASINPNSRSVQTIRNIDHQVYITREVRIHTVYQPYFSRPVVIYNDPYNSFFWYWLLDQSLERQATWAYCHRAEMDEARYRALMSHNSRLEARVKQLEAQKRAVDPTYVPPGIDYDLQYTDDYVDGIVNPHTVKHSSGWFVKLLWWTFTVLLSVVVLWLVLGLIFVKRWN